MDFWTHRVAEILQEMSQGRISLKHPMIDWDSLISMFYHGVSANNAAIRIMGTFKDAA